MAPKKLIIVIDRATELDHHWRTSLKDRLADIVRYLHHGGSTSQDSGASRPWLGIVTFGSGGPCTEPQVLPCGWSWTQELNTFLRWLSAARFTGGEFTEAALKTGISTALEIIAAVRDNNEALAVGQSHCILVTSYKSLPVSKPEDQTSESQKLTFRKLDRFHVDASSVARQFVQSPRLEEIFKAGNEFYKPTFEYFTVEQENFTYTFLISDNFPEAHAVLDGDMPMVEHNSAEVSPINQPGLLGNSDHGNLSFSEVDETMPSLEDTLIQPWASLLHGDNRVHDGDMRSVGNIVGNGYTEMFVLNQPAFTFRDMNHCEEWLLENNDNAGEVHGLEGNVDKSSTNHESGYKRCYGPAFRKPRFIRKP